MCVWLDNNRVGYHDVRQGARRMNTTTITVNDYVQPRRAMRSERTGATIEQALPGGATNNDVLQLCINPTWR